MPSPEARAKAALYSLQHREAKTELPTKITCICDHKVPIRFMHKCLYCSLWFCAECGEEHFGMTRDEWRAKNPLAADDVDTCMASRTYGPLLPAPEPEE